MILFSVEIRVVIRAKFPTRPIGSITHYPFPLTNNHWRCWQWKSAMLGGSVSRAISHHFRDCDLHFHFTLTYCTFQTFHLSSPRPLKPCLPDTAIAQKHSRVSSNFRCFGTPSKPPGEVPLLFDCFRFNSSFYQMGFVFFLLGSWYFDGNFTWFISKEKKIIVVVVVAKSRCIFQRLVVWHEQNKSLGVELKCFYYKIRRVFS